jgi:NAD-dependent dihydropyrimidine dehydrogenase PreA subunit
MIAVDRALCGGCGVCVDECPIEAIALIDGIAVVDTDCCNGCGECVEVCPNQALAWVAEPVLETGAEPSSLAVIQPPAEIIHVGTAKPVPWRRSLFPVVGGALIWVGRELVPRLAPLALDVLEGALDRRLGRWTRQDRVRPIVTSDGSERGRRRRYRHRRRRRQA